MLTKIFLLLKKKCATQKFNEKSVKDGQVEMVKYGILGTVSIATGSFNSYRIQQSS
jgi:hypothetical protein